MGKWLMLLIVFLAVGCVGMEKSVPQSEVPRMTKEELKSRLGSPDLVLLDVRAGKDWTGSDRKIAGATREDPREVEKWGEKYAKGKTLVLYCA